MRRSIPVLAVLFLLCLLQPALAWGQFSEGLNLETESSGKEGPMIEFEKTTYDLGSFAQGETVVLDVPFKSVGSDPLEVDRVKPSCACSDLKWTETAVAPGESGNMHAEIDTKDMHELGDKTKYFVFFYNGNPGIERVTVNFNLIEGEHHDDDGDGMSDQDSKTKVEKAEKVENHGG